MNAGHTDDGMTTRTAPTVLLGPQRFESNLAEALAQAGLTGPFAAITAGWQEREGEDEDLAQEVGAPIENLSLHRRAEAVFRSDADLFTAHRARQDRLRALQELYRIRVSHALGAYRALEKRPAFADLVAAEQEDAMASLRRLEAHHLESLRAIHDAFDRETRLSEHPELARHREEIGAILGRCKTLLVAGGHVAVLLNRLRLFDVRPLAWHLPVVGWSAGAMALTERVVVFHDSPPQGPGHAELLDEGLGFVRGLVVLPDARHRLKLKEPARVALLARRFAPAVCVAMDENARVWMEDTGFVGQGSARRLSADGAVTRLPEAQPQPSPAAGDRP